VQWPKPLVAIVLLTVVWPWPQRPFPWRRPCFGLMTILFSDCLIIDLAGNQTLRTQDSSDPRHTGTGWVGPNCLDTFELVPKCPKDSSDLSAELFHSVDQSISPHGPNCLSPGTELSCHFWIKLTVYHYFKRPYTKNAICIITSAKTPFITVCTT